MEMKPVFDVARQVQFWYDVIMEAIKTCEECDKEYLVCGPREIEQRRFCGHSCSAVHRNRVAPKRCRSVESSRRTCRVCGKVFAVKKTECGGYSKSRSCDDCPRTKTVPPEKTVSESTKGDIFNRRSNWQSARSAIQKHARLVYVTSRLPMACVVCGYDKHVEIAHRIGVSVFPATASVREINHPDNLAALCPNHHWEHDHGFFTLSDDVVREVAVPGTAPGSSGLWAPSEH